MSRILGISLFLLLALVAQAQDTVKTRILEEGRGESIEGGQEAVLAYTLTLEDGTVIEKKDALQPFRMVFGDAGVIPGLTHGVDGMKVGEKREIRVPPSLGYGPQGLGSIPPDATLIFEVELLEISEEPELSSRMQDEDFLARRHARDISKPAIFEYLIRDFFTKPWRYEDGHVKIWKDNARLGAFFLVLLVFYLVGKKKGFLIP